MVKLADFGLAEKLNHSGSKREGYGTLWYKAPEAFNGETQLKSDIWALAITLIEMAEGKNPYADFKSSKDVMDAILQNPPPALTSSQWSPDFVDFIRVCLAKDIQERWDAPKLINVSCFLLGLGIASLREGRGEENWERFLLGVDQGGAQCHFR